MPKNDSQQNRELDKLVKLQELLSNDTITPKELETFMLLALDFITKAKNQFDTVAEQTLNEVQLKLNTIMSHHSEMSQEMTDMVKKCDQMCKEVMRSKPKDGKDGVSPDLETVAYEASKLVEEKIIPLLPTIDDLKNDLPKMSTGIRDALETLYGEERLDISAIRGWDKTIEDIKSSGKEVRLVGGTNGIQLYVGGAKKGNVKYVNLIAGSGMSINYNSANGRNDITFNASSSGLSVLTVTGTIDDSNLTFSCASTPLLVIINGISYNGSTGSITWTYVGTTLTLSAPIGTGGDIYAIG